ncbi:MAG: sulfatase-like hydrolase/transferase [Chitinophagaceae bacterium]
MKSRLALQRYFEHSFLYLYGLIALAVIRCIFFIVNRGDLAENIPAVEYGFVLWYGLRSDLAVVLIVLLPVVMVQLVCNRWNDSIKKRLLTWYYVSTVVLVSGISLFDVVYFNNNHRRLTLADFYIIRDNVGLLLPFAKKYWYLLLLLLLVGLGAFMICLRWLKRIKQAAFNAKQCLLFFTIYAAALFLVLFDFKTGYFFTTSSGYFVMKSNHVPFSANTITELLASRRYNQPIDMEKWRFMNDEQAFLLHPVLHELKLSRSPKKNIVVFIIESASQEDFAENDQRKTTLPFLDSLMKQSWVFDNFFANAVSSPSGFDAIIGGLPEGNAPDFFLTGYGYNKTQWFTQVLKTHHYSTNFFYGVSDFTQSFLKSSKNYELDHDFGYRNYQASHKDFDGYYGVYDHIFFPVVAGEMSKIKTPFLSVIYNVSTHIPFNLIPPAIFDRLPDFTKSNGKSLRYYDDVMRQFFCSVEKQPWFANTIFLFVADHFSRAQDRTDKSMIGRFKIPMFIYTPDGSLKGHYPYTGQQIDIPVTLLDIIGSGGSFFSYGRSLLDSSAKRVAFNKFGKVLQALDDQHLLQYNMITKRVDGYYQYKNDTALVNNLYPYEAKKADSLLHQLQAFWQVYALTLQQNKMHPDKYLMK